MHELPASWTAMMSVAFTLGMKHGLDADHLAAIDGLTRFNWGERPGLARWCGSLFSLGHGTVVVAIAIVVACVAPAWAVPGATERIGTWISIAFLAALGVMNIASVLLADRAAIVRPVAFKGRLFGRIPRAGSAWTVATIGALFAVSFDTLSQAAFFAVAGVHFGGLRPALALAALFTAGMLATDGLNGLWIARLLRRADRVARIASRIMGLVVGALSLALAGIAASRIASPPIAAWADRYETGIGVALLAVVAVAFALSLRAATRGAPGAD